MTLAWLWPKQRPRYHPCHACFEMMQENGTGICAKCEDARLSSDPNALSARIASRFVKGERTCLTSI